MCATRRAVEAGNTPIPAMIVLSFSVHPRARGEHLAKAAGVLAVDRVGQNVGVEWVIRVRQGGGHRMPDRKHGRREGQGQGGASGRLHRRRCVLSLP